MRTRPLLVNCGDSASARYDAESGAVSARVSSASRSLTALESESRCATSFGLSVSTFGAAAAGACVRANASDESAALRRVRACVSAATSGAVSGRAAGCVDVDGIECVICWRRDDQRDERGDERPKTDRADEHGPMHSVSRACREPHGTRNRARKLTGHVRHAAILPSPSRTPVACIGRPAASSRPTRLADDGPRRESGVAQTTRAEPFGLRSRVFRCRRRAYWTVIVPFMPIARCGVQWNGYAPGFTPPNEMT